VSGDAVAVGGDGGAALAQVAPPLEGVARLGEEEEVAARRVVEADRRRLPPGEDAGERGDAVHLPAGEEGAQGGDDLLPRRLGAGPGPQVEVGEAAIRDRE